MGELTDEQKKKAILAWRQRGFDDGSAGRVARTPLRDDGGIAMDAYNGGYLSGKRERERERRGS